MDKYINTDELLALASEARGRSYSPYSRFPVGAALLSDSGHVYSGCNVENVSFGLTMCAERVCAGMAIAAGDPRFELIVIVADSKEPIVPCGACRQVLAEFSSDLRILSVTTNGPRAEFRLDELLPRPRQGILG